jgi:hypothetical protein
VSRVKARLRGGKAVKKRAIVRLNQESPSKASLASGKHPSGGSCEGLVIRRAKREEAVEPWEGRFT